MAQNSFIWEAGEGGDESPHSIAEWGRVEAAIAGVGSANEGVLRRVLNELAPSSIAGDTQIRIASGWAIVDGRVYENTANEDFTPVTPAVGTTGRRAVLRADWSAQTVRIVEISSADGTATIPALTQTSGTTYEIPLCSYTVTTGGDIGAFADEREFAGADPAVAGSFEHELTDSTRVVLGYFVGGQTAAVLGSSSDALRPRQVGIGMNANSTRDSTVNFSTVAGGRTRLPSPAASIESHIGVGLGTGTSSLTGAVATVIPERNFRLLMRATPQRPHANLERWVAGLHAVTALSNAGNGVYFRRITTGNVFAVTRQTGVETTTDLGAMDDTTLRTWEVSTSDGGESWQFYIDGTQVASHNTNTPQLDVNLVPLDGAGSNASGTFTASHDIERLLFTADKP